MDLWILMCAMILDDLQKTTGSIFDLTGTERLVQRILKQSLTLVE